MTTLESLLAPIPYGARPWLLFFAVLVSGGLLAVVLHCARTAWRRRSLERALRGLSADNLTDGEIQSIRQQALRVLARPGEESSVVASLAERVLSLVENKLIRQLEDRVAIRTRSRC